MSFSSNPVLVTVTISLAVQLIIMGLLLYSLWLKKRQMYRRHGITMAAAVILHLIMIFAIMIPSFVLAVIPAYILINPLELASAVGLIHGILGSVAAAMGVWLVVSWRFNENLTGCFQRKKFMFWTLGVWAAALFFGVLLYWVFVGPLLMG
jgi:hypothetical protein